ncbi:MAG: hypothetical protein IJN77_07265 [Oscillospiraceae bacterium]|nr:hypothetical protein [Oscillospiraceae bacterium]MBR6609918.1 hypothetical protein [Oscillospiraceae bacterium]
MIKRTDYSEEEKRAIALKHSKKVTRYKILFVVSLVMLLVPIASLGKMNDTLSQAGISGGGVLMFLSAINLSVANHCPFCGLKMDNRMGQRNPLMMNFPAVCPFCGEKLRY